MLTSESRRVVRTCELDEILVENLRADIDCSAESFTNWSFRLGCCLHSGNTSRVTISGA